MGGQTEFQTITILLISDDDDVIREIGLGLRKHRIRAQLTVARSRRESIALLDRENEPNSIEPYPVILVEAKLVHETEANPCDSLAAKVELGNSAVFLISSLEEDYEQDIDDGISVAGYLQKPISQNGYDQLPGMLEYFARTTEPAPVDSLERSAA